MSQGRVRVRRYATQSRNARRRTARACATLLLAAAPLLASAPDAGAAAFASQVVSYSAGTASNPGFRLPQSALGAPNPITGENPMVFPGLVTPFSPPFQADEIVSVGEGGQITLQLSHYAVPGAGAEIGIFSNVGLQDASYPNGQSTNPASVFSPRRPINVEASRDGVSFVPVTGSLRLEVPTLFYSNAGPFDSGIPANPQPTDFGIPFVGSLSSFDGKNWAQTLATFNTPGGYSAGGTWIDISSTGLDQVGYIRLSLPDDGPLEADDFILDAVSVASAAAGAPVPEPSSLALAVLGMALLRRRR